MIAKLASLIRTATISLVDEKEAQADLAHILDQAGIEHEREVRLGWADVIDFMVGDIGVELKLKGARKREVYHQLVRYARSPRVGKLLLASSLSMGLPPTIEGKDAYFVRLGEAWL